MERLTKLMEYRQGLVNEEQSLKEIQKMIQKQINALEIEKLHLESVANKPVAKNTNPPDINKSHDNDNDIEPKQLDLNVPSHIKHYEEEEEEEDDEDI